MTAIPPLFGARAQVPGPAASLAELAPIAPDALSERRLALLEPLLEQPEIPALRATLLTVRPLE